MNDPLRVLLLEDSPDDAQLMVLRLEEAGFTLDWKRVQSKRDFLAALADSPDLILADYHLPGFSGIEALHLRNEHGPDIPFILVSGTVGEDIAVQAMRDGADDYLLKDRPARLGEAARRALEQRELRDEQRRAHELLRASEERYRTLTEAAQDMITVINREGRVEYANAFATRQFGVLPQELIGKQLSDIFPAEIANRQQGNLQKVFDTGQSLYVEAPVIFRGQTFWLGSRIAPIKDEAGQVNSVLIVSRDITERKQAEKSLREAEQKYRSLVEQIPVITYIDAADRSGTTLYVSPQIESILHVSAAEWMERDISIWEEMLHPEDRERAIAEYSRFVHSGQRYDVEYRMIARDGRLVWFHDRAVLMKDEHGNPSLIHGVMQDITNSKEAEEKLRQNEIRFRALIEKSTDAISIIAADGRIIFESPANPPILDYAEGELAGRNIFDLIHPQDRPRLRDSFARLAKVPGDYAQSQFRAQHKDGSWRWVEATATNLLNEPGVQGIVINHRDITERKRAEQMIAESEARYRDLVENIHELICTHDLAGNLLSINRAVAEMLGYDHEEMIGRNLRDFLAPDVRGLFDSYLSLVQKRGTASGVMNVQTKSGEIRVWEYHNTLRTEGVEKPIVRGYAHDVTEKRRVEQALRESERRFRSLVENSSDEISILNAKGELLYESPTTHPTLGYPPGEYVGRSLFSLIHPDDLERVQTQFARLAENPQLHPRDQFRLRHRDGEWRWVEAVGSNLLADPSVRGVVINYHDITERKQAEEKLKAQFDELQRWYNATVDREERILQLKHEVNELLRKLNEPIRYPSAE